MFSHGRRRGGSGAVDDCITPCVRRYYLGHWVDLSAIRSTVSGVAARTCWLELVSRRFALCQGGTLGDDLGAAMGEDSLGLEKGGVSCST